MSTPARVGGFLAVIALIFGAAFGVGKLFDDEPATYRVTADYEPGMLSLAIFENDNLVLDYDVRHEKRLHLIAVRKDFGGYQHVHPQADNSGGWVVPDLNLSPGAWRLYADFKPVGGEPVVAHDDIQVAGDSRAPAPKPITLRASVDGYRVEFGGPDTLVPGMESAVNFQVSKNDRDVTDLEPYLGAYGHLVAIREADLQYLHVHPEEGGRAGPDIPFNVAVGEPGRYRLYLEFKHDGVVRTAEFVVEAKTGAQLEHDMDEMDHGDH